MKVLFAHGFEGTPDGGKPTYMSEALGWDVVSPVMSKKGWNIEQETDVLLEYIDAGDFDIIAGSSMGGLAAANASALRPDAQFGLLLIAPAFGLAEMWHERLNPSEMAESIRDLYLLPRDDRESMGTRGREAFLNNYSIESGADSFERILFGLVSEDCSFRGNGAIG